MKTLSIRNKYASRELLTEESAANDDDTDLAHRDEQEEFSSLVQ